MSPIQRQLNKLNRVSRGILDELEKEQPSLEFIRQEMDRRQEFVDVLGNLTNSYRDTTLSPDEQSSIQSLFEEFAQLNESIQTALQNVLDQHRQKLSEAIKQRKAEESYHILKEPDISYF